MMARDMIGKGTQCMEIEKPMGGGKDASFFRGDRGEIYSLLLFCENYIM